MPTLRPAVPALAAAALLLAACVPSAGPARPPAAPLYRQLTADDTARADATVQAALERQPSGASLGWQNPATGRAGTVTPVRTFRAGGGLFCREFDETLSAGGRTERSRATACRDAGGVWRPV